MFTECPECQTTFRLSAKDLSRAQGKVRCGDCGVVFNALEHLIEDVETETPLAEGGSEPWLTDSSKNPSGDLNPDLDAYERTFDAQDDTMGFGLSSLEIIHSSDDDLDDDDLGEILYIEPDEVRGRDDGPYAAEPESPVADEAIETVAINPPAPTTSIKSKVLAALFDTANNLTKKTADTNEDDEPEGATELDQQFEDMLEDEMDAEPEDENPLVIADFEEDFQEDFESTFEDSLTPELDASPDDDADDADDEFDPSVWETIPGVGGADFGQPMFAEADSDAHEFIDLGDLEATGEPHIDFSAAEKEEPTAEMTDDDSDGPEAADETLEFNVPEEKWGVLFDTLQEQGSASIWKADEEPDNEAAELAAIDAFANDDDADDADTDEAPEELIAGADKLFAEGTVVWHGSSSGTARTLLQGLALLILAVGFCGQLLHYNRDALAADEKYGEWVRMGYAKLDAAVGSYIDAKLYPEWPMSSYEIRSSEAIVGESGADVLDIRAQIAVVSQQVVGMPRLRIVLRDRWANPVAARDFAPDEYMSEGTIPPSDGLLRPGALLAATVSIADPGAGAQGFELELCLPRRNTGLECNTQPFK